MRILAHLLRCRPSGFMVMLPVLEEVQGVLDQLVDEEGTSLFVSREVEVPLEDSAGRKFGVGACRRYGVGRFRGRLRCPVCSHPGFARCCFHWPAAHDSAGRCGSTSLTWCFATSSSLDRRDGGDRREPPKVFHWRGRRGAPRAFRFWGCLCRSRCGSTAPSSHSPAGSTSRRSNIAISCASGGLRASPSWAWPFSFVQSQCSRGNSRSKHFVGLVTTCRTRSSEVDQVRGSCNWGAYSRPRCLRRIGGGGIQGAPHEHRSSSSTAGLDEADCGPYAEAPSCGQGPCFSRPGQRKRQLAKRRHNLCGSRSLCEDHGRCDPDRPSDSHQCFQRLGAASGSGEQWFDASLYVERETKHELPWGSWPVA